MSALADCVDMIVRLYRNDVPRTEIQKRVERYWNNVWNEMNHQETMMYDAGCEQDDLYDWESFWEEHRQISHELVDRWDKHPI